MFHSIRHGPPDSVRSTGRHTPPFGLTHEIDRSAGAKRWPDVQIISGVLAASNETRTVQMPPRSGRRQRPGERAAVEAMCAKIPPNASVLIVERVTANRFTQVVRGMCDRPTAQVLVEAGKNTAKEEDVRRLIDRVRAAGRVPVLLAAEEGQRTPYGPQTQVMALVSRQDE